MDSSALPTFLPSKESTCRDRRAWLASLMDAPDRGRRSAIAEPYRDTRRLNLDDA